jgi:hypothetical protein
MAWMILMTFQSLKMTAHGNKIIVLPMENGVLGSMASCQLLLLLLLLLLSGILTMLTTKVITSFKVILKSALQVP